MICANCGLPASKHCAKCTISYCSRKCQIADWQTHKSVCGDVAASAIDLGSLGTLISVTPHGGASRIAAELTFIVDRSGSMADLTALIVNAAIPTALEKIGYPADKSVRVITFDSIVECNTCNTAGLARLDVESRGLTNMAGVFPALGELRGHHVILVFSDGEIGDKTETISAAAAMSPSAASITVLLYRVMSGTRANPDTRALTCVGVLNTEGKVPLIDVETYRSGSTLTKESTVTSIVNHLTTGLQSTALVSPVDIVAPIPAIIRMPGAPPMKMMSVMSGRQSDFLLAPGVNPGSLTCNGVPLVPTTRTLSGEASIRPFLEYVESSLKLWAVAGMRRVEIDAALQWFQTLEPRLVSTIAITNTIHTRDRVANLLAKVRSRNSTVINRILTLANSGRVSALNSAQQAAFLRNDVVSTATARRIQQSNADLDWDKTCQNAVRALAAKTSTIQPGDRSAHSFISTDTWPDIIAAAADMLPEINNLTAVDILPLIGGLGIPFRARHGDFPDPWAWRVDKVYPHGSYYLNESDLRSAHEHVLLLPGAGNDATITGVMPLRSLHPAAYDAYMAAASPLADLQAGITMRSIIGQIPGDRLARDAAVALCLVQQTITGTEFDRKVLADVRAQIERDLRNYARDLANDLASADPRVWLTGDRDVSGILKPFILVFASQNCAALRADADALSRCLRALYSLDAYHAAKRAFHGETRAAVIEALLGIDLEAYRSVSDVGEPFTPTPPPPSPPAVDFDRAARYADQLSWMPSTATLNALASVINPEAHPFDIYMIHLNAAFQSLVCEHEDDRVDKTLRVSKQPTLSNNVDCRIAIRDKAASIYAADYAARLAAKMAIETRIRLEQLVATLVASTDEQEFLTTLIAGIPNRSAPGYAALDAALLDMTINVPIRLEKLWITTLGRNAAGEPIWANGNVLNGNYTTLSEIFFALDPSRDRWQLLRQIKEKYGVYQYRTVRNRHDHGNDKPSFWAFGFSTLELYRATVSEEEYAKYVAIHTNCCGF